MALDEFEKIQNELDLKFTELKLLRDENVRVKNHIDQVANQWKNESKENSLMQAKLLNEISILKNQTNKMESENNIQCPGKDTAIIIITYNNSQLIKKQIECVRRFCTDDVDIIIVDNSTDREVIDAIKYYNDTELHCKYLKTDATSKNGSDSHSFSANLSYIKFKDDYKYLMYLDFDCFPIKPFSIKALLGDNIMTGVGQNKDGIEYFWPGCVLFDNERIDRNLVDFSTSHDLKLDTGGLLFRVIERYTKDKCPFLPEIHVQNPNFNKSFYNFYADINTGGFMHFINSSHWNKADGDSHNERMNSLLNILEEKINGK